MATLSLYVGIIGNITSVLIFLSPIGTFLRIIKQGSTEEFESLPYICTLLNCTLWVYYGVTKPGGLLIVTINGFGTIVEAIYVILFLIYAPPTMKAKTATLAGILNVGFLLIAVLVTQSVFEGEALIQGSQVSNGIGFVFGIIQLVLYALYKNAKPSSNTLEEGGQHQPLISSSDQAHGIE